MTLPFGPLDADAWLVCVDMQRLFLEPGDWFCAAGLDILPQVSQLAAAAPGRCVFTRFVTPPRPEAAVGAWRRYYDRWASVTTDVAGRGLLDLHRDLSGRGSVFDKTTYDAFQARPFATFIADARPSALVIFGIETEICVLATALSAVDLGIRVIVPVDAVASSDPAGHRAAIDALFPRFDQQIELVESASILEAIG